MNRKFLVTLLRKDIQELDMITEGFIDMTEYPAAIIQLAKRKADDIQSYIRQLSEIQIEQVADMDEELVLETTEAMELTDFEEHYKEANVSYPDLDPEPDEIPLDNVELVEKANEIAPEILIENELVVVIEPIINVQNEEQPKADNKIEVVSNNQLHARTGNSLETIIANKRIADIKQAINISDRFRFQRELFRGNGEDMNKMINYINQLATFEEVQSFLQSKYNWKPENEAAKDFYHIVKRKFI